MWTDQSIQELLLLLRATNALLSEIHAAIEKVAANILTAGGKAPSSKR